MFKSFTRNVFFKSFLPKGKAWSGEKTQLLAEAINDFWINVCGIKAKEYQGNQFLKTITEESSNDYFNQINSSPKIFNDNVQNKQPIIELFTQSKRHVTTQDWEDIATKLGLTLTLVNGSDAFTTPALVAPTPAPLTVDSAKYILYIKIESTAGGGGFPYTFPFPFSNEVSPSDGFNLYRSILNSNIELRSF